MNDPTPCTRCGSPRTGTFPYLCSTCNRRRWRVTVVLAGLVVVCLVGVVSFLVACGSSVPRR